MRNFSISTERKTRECVVCVTDKSLDQFGGAAECLTNRIQNSVHLYILHTESTLINTTGLFSILYQLLPRNPSFMAERHIF